MTVRDGMAERQTLRPNGWTTDDVEALIGYWSQGFSNAKIGKLMNRTSTAISMKAHRLNLPAKTEVAPPAPGGSNRATITTRNKQGKVRPCLCCNTSFWSTGAGNRICDDCKSGPEWGDGGSYSVRFSGN